ncbi:unnamed protein product [Rotaria sordida]|uniref:Uncharacterized protein n=1 Tax=Rotaria sordida TaxID=392033 RepID=A0A814DTG9_9BILA|nr:unnamed protein product [Rotaria sordida]
MAESLSDDDKTDSIESSSFQDNYEDFNKEFMKKLLYNQQNVNWCDFDIMKDGQLSFWECEFLNESENWTKSTCSCPACLKIINDLINQSQNEDTSRIGQLIHQMNNLQGSQEEYIDYCNVILSPKQKYASFDASENDL